MATQTLESDPFQITSQQLPGLTRSLNFKTVTTFEKDNNNKIIDGSRKTVLQYQATPGGIFQSAATSTEGGKVGSWTLTNAANSNDPILGQAAINSLQTPNGVLNQETQKSVGIAATKAKLSPEEIKKLSDNTKNQGNPDDNKTGGDPKNATQTQFQTIAETAAKSYKGRKEYPKDLRYPEKMNKNQDCIQFKIIEYKASKLGLSGSEDIKLRTTFGTRSPLSTITLPMPSGGISDRNSVNWQGSGLDVAQDALATVAMNAILGGAAAGADAAKKELTKATAGNKDLLAAIIAAKASEKAVGANNLLSRAFGVELNPNLELLFNSPELREFSFSFKMTPRSKGEAQIVRSIIRTFKQAMSVKRSESVLLLKSPHTFRISYLTSTKDHPYLNHFKECALTNCSVNYTPDGQYMSYNDSDPGGRSMTAYELSLNFSELEPIFDDDYTRLPGGDEEDSKDYSIGY